MIEFPPGRCQTLADVLSVGASGPYIITRKPAPEQLNELLVAMPWHRLPAVESKDRQGHD